MLSKEDKVLAAYIRSKYYYKIQRIKNNWGYLILKPCSDPYGTQWVPFCNILFKTLSDVIDYLELENAHYENTETKEAKCKSFLASMAMIN